MRADSGFYGVWEAAIAAVADWVVWVPSALTLSVLWGMCLSGALRCLFIHVTTKVTVAIFSHVTQTTQWTHPASNVEHKTKQQRKASPSSAPRYTAAPTDSNSAAKSTGTEQGKTAAASDR